VELNR